MKTCKKCGVEKEVSAFYTNGEYIRNVCKECRILKQNQYYCNNREKITLRKKAYYNNHKEEFNLKAREHWNNNKDRLNEARNLDYKINPKKYSLRRIKQLYGLTADDVENKLLQQENRCAICRETFIKVPHIDHDHVSGKIRMLLCNHCNRGLGAFRDNVQYLDCAIDYLNKFKEEKNATITG
jgi:hypothetical protein